MSALEIHKEIRDILDANTNIEDWIIEYFYSSSEKRKVYVKLIRYSYDEFVNIQDTLAEYGYSNIELIDME
jgi:hypothetical protein